MIQELFVFIACLALRFVKIFPGAEPVLGCTMPFSKKTGAIGGAVFAFAVITAFDALSGHVGLWTLYTGIAYALVGLACGLVSLKSFKRKMGFVFAATVFYDLVTALAFGFQFGQPIQVTLVAQVPFTLMHLFGNAAAVIVLSPLVVLVLNKKPVSIPAAIASLISS